MAKQFPGFSDDHRAFIAAQHIYFVATAVNGSRINLSPKGMDSLRVTGPNALSWLNLTGSGNETAAHLAIDPRMTVMWCGFEKRPMILRAYGQARMIHRTDADWAEAASLFPDTPGARQVCQMSVDLVQTSCGFAVPFMDFAGERPTLRDWATGKGEDGLRTYWDERNRNSLDGLPTGIEGNL